MRTALRNDTQFGELLDTPLMIHIAALAYKDKLLSELQSKETPNQQWKYLLDAYIEAMFRRRSKEIRYTQRQIKYYLSWLARQMIQHNQVVYFFERMQPTWLTHQQQQKYIFYICLLNGVVVGFAVGLFFALFLGLSGGLIGGLIGGLVGAIQARFWGEILIAEAFDWSAVWIELDDGLSDGLGFGLIVGLGFGLISSLSDGPLFGLIGSLIVGVGVGLGCGLTFGLAGALAIVLGSDLTGIGIDARKMTKQDFDQAMHNAFVGCLIGGLVGMLSGWFVDGFPTALVGALAGMLLVGLNYGGRAIIQLLTLRWLLSQNGIIPFCNRDLTTFLDYCAERIFLRKVGGGYMFIHRLLMEHFAAMYNEESGKATLK